MQLTNEQRIFIVTTYGETKNVKATVQQFQAKYDGRLLSENTVRKTVVKFQEYGTIHNRNKGHSGRRLTKRTPENIQLVQNRLQEDAYFSCRRNGVNLSKATVSRILKTDLRLFPYKAKICQRLNENDMRRRSVFCRWFNGKSERFVEDLVVSDEAAFHMNGSINSQNHRTYSPYKQPPRNFFEKPNSREKLSVWIGLTGTGLIIGPIFYEQNLNGQAYLDMLNEIIIPQLQTGYGERLNRVWWMQDGAPCHRSIPVKNRLFEVFGERVIGVGHRVEWPPRSPDLTPCDFFLWGYLKDKVYATPPTDLQELRERISHHVNELKDNRESIRKSMRAMRARCQKCLANNGGHWL